VAPVSSALAAVYVPDFSGSALGADFTIVEGQGTSNSAGFGTAVLTKVSDNLPHAPNATFKSSYTYNIGFQQDFVAGLTLDPVALGSANFVFSAASMGNIASITIGAGDKYVNSTFTDAFSNLVGVGILKTSQPYDFGIRRQGSVWSLLVNGSPFFLTFGNGVQQFGTDEVVFSIGLTGRYSDAPGYGTALVSDFTITTPDVCGIAGACPTTGNVPEPASWVMLIAGFGLTGAAVRRRRGVLA
jgi:hypothetical protein